MSLPIPEKKKRVPSFDEVMGENKQPPKVPSYDEVMGIEKKNPSENVSKIGTPVSNTGSKTSQDTEVEIPLVDASTTKNGKEIELTGKYAAQDGDKVGADTPEGNFTDSRNPIDRIKNATEYLNRVKPVSEKEMEMSRGTAIALPDTEYNEYGKKVLADLEKIGIKKDFVDAISDLPEDSFNDISKDDLVSLYKTNPIKFHQIVNEQKNRLAVRKSTIENTHANNTGVDDIDPTQMGIHVGNQYLGTQEEQNPKSFGELENVIAKKQSIIDQSLPTQEDKNKAHQRLKETYSSYITPLDHDLMEEYNSSPIKDKIDPTQYAGLKTLQLFEPEKYKQYVDILNTDVKKVDPSLLKPLGNKQSELHKNEQISEPIDMQISKESILRELSNSGRNNLYDAINSKQYDLNQANGQATTPEEKDAIHQQYVSNQSGLQSISEDAKLDDQRYPLTAQLKFDQQAKEITQEGQGMAQYGANKFLKGFLNTADTIDDVVTGLFGSDADNTKLQMKRMGAAQKWEAGNYLPENLRTENSPYILQASPELKKKVTDFLDGRSISSLNPQEKQSLNDLVAKNQNQIQTITNPEFGKSKNFWTKATGYAVAGFTGDIASFMAQTAGLGALGVPAKAAELTTLFTTTYSDAFNEATKEGMSPSEAHQYGLLHGGIMMLAGTVSSKFENVKNILAAGKSPLSKEIAGMTEAAWDKVVNGNKPLINKIASSAKSVVGDNAKTIATYGVGTSIANDLADKGFFNKDISGDEIVNHAVQSAKDLAIGSIGLAGVGFISHITKNPVTVMDKMRIWEMGDNPDMGKMRVDEAVQKGDLSPVEGEARKKAIDNISKLIQKVPINNDKGKPLTDQQKVDYLYNSVVKTKAKEAVSDLPPSQAADAEHKAAVADYENELILDPKTDKQLESRKNALEKILEPQTDDNGKKIELNEAVEKDTKAELEAVNNQIEFNQRYEKIKSEPTTVTNESTENNIPVQTETKEPTVTEPNKTEPAASEGQGGKFEAKARKIADKIINSETPSWLKIDDPNIKKKGIGENEIKKALADATIKMGKLLDKGVEFKDAVKEAVKELVDMMGEGRRSDIEKGFEKQYNEQLGEDNRTGIKKEVTNEVRQSRGLPKVEFPKMGTDTAELEAAKKRVDSGESNPIESVQSILNEKRGYKDEAEAFDMQYYAHQLDKHNENLSRQLAEAKTPEEHSEILNQKMQLSDEIDAQTEAAQLAGNKWGKIGNAMQPVINDAGRIFRNDKQIIQDVYGENMPPKVKMQIDTLTKERDEAIAAKIKVEEQLRQKMAEKGFEKVKEQARKTAKRSETKEALKKEEDELLKELKQSIKKDLGNVNSGIPIPKETLETLGKLAVNYFKQGVNGVEALVDRLYEGLKDTGISRSQIKEAVANYEPLTIARETERLNKKADLLMDKVTPPSVKTTGNKFKPSEQVDLTKPSKEQLTFRKSNEWVKANQRVANAEFRMKILKRKAFESEKNYYQRALAWVGRLTRLSVLSGYNVLAKLAAALTVGGGMKRIPEQAIGAVYSKIFQKIANQAPIEGQNNWLNAKAEAAFYKDFFNPKKFAQNSWDILKTGSTKLGRRLGSAEYEHVPILYIPTDLHQIIKDPLKRATFESSFKNHMIWAEKNGLDINDPLVVNSIENAAYKRAQYEIFQESNKLSRWFTSQKAALEKKGNIGNTAKFVVDFLIPVSTVPANIVRRVTTTSPLGLIRGGKEVISAYRNGIEKLTPEQADHVMQQLKQGTLGTALWLVGWYGYQSFGGLYSQFNPNKKREEGDKMSDVMVVDGHEIPKPVQHALPLEVIQLASTARRIYENYRENKNASMPEALYKAGLGSIGAMAEQIPVIETPVHAVMATKDPVEADKFKEDMERRIKPQILREFGVFNNEFKKSKEGKFLEDKQNKIVDLHKEAVHPLDKEGNKVKVSEEMFNKLTQVRESKIQDEISKLMSKGADVWDGNKNTHVEAKDMTPAQVKDWLMKTSTKAKKEAMDEVFGEQPEPTEKPEIETAN